MQITVKAFTKNIFKNSDCLVLVGNEKDLKSFSADLPAELKNQSQLYLSSSDFKATSGSSQIFYHAKGLKRVLFICSGKNKVEDSEKLSNKIIQQVKSLTVSQVNIVLGNSIDQEQLASVIAQHLASASYQYVTTKKIKSPANHKIAVYSEQKNIVNALNKGLAIGQAMNITKELGNLPGNICTPEYLAKQAKTLASKNEKVKTSILTEKQLSDQGFGAFMSVAKGSIQKPRLIAMEYKGGKKSSKPYVIVGKGITFDSGGISLKPGAAMDEMKYDMCGAASVLGVLNAVVALKLPINVVGVIAAAENMPSGGASKPGDVVTSLSGKTIEILNTDAEGRLVLCDTLTWIKRFNPETVIDIATLTGACIIALGHYANGLFSNDDDLAAELLSAGKISHDRAWQLPIWDDYKKLLDSPFADLGNIGGRSAGSITAACFLSAFTEDYRWAHLDIAGTAWNSGGNKGATGRPVPLLMEYLIAQSNK